MKLNKNQQNIYYKPQQPGTSHKTTAQNYNYGQHQNPSNQNKDYGYTRDDMGYGRNARH